MTLMLHGEQRIIDRLSSRGISHTILDGRIIWTAGS